MVRVMHRLHVRPADEFRNIRRAAENPAEDPDADDERP